MAPVVVYPGSFDPVTNGHLDIISRCQALFPKVLVAILRNPNKQGLFSLEERLEVLGEILADQANVEVVSFEGLLVRFARERGASVIVRGLRAVSDFEYEFQMALMNRQLDEQIETLFMVPREDYTFLSSSLIKEVYSLGGSVADLVPAVVDRRLKSRFSEPEKT